MGVPMTVFTSARAALEAARGTDLTPTRLIYGESFTLDHTVATIRPEELRASYEGHFQAAAGPETSRVTIGGRMSYEDAAWWGMLAFKTVTATGANPYTYTFLPTNTSDDVKTVTMQLGDSAAIGTSPAVKLNYGMLDTFNLHVEKNDDGAATFTGTILFAKALTQITAFTGSLTDRVTTPMSSNNAVVKIDTTTIGTTTDSAVVAYDFTLNNNPVPFYALDNTLAAQAVYRPQHRSWTLQVTRQYSNATEFTAYVAKTVRKIRLLITTGANASFQLDTYGVWTARTYAEVDGIVTEVLTLEPVYDVTSTSSVNCIVINTNATTT